jgi:hypothetical protein
MLTVYSLCSIKKLWHLVSNKKLCSITYSSSINDRNIFLNPVLCLKTTIFALCLGIILCCQFEWYWLMWGFPVLLIPSSSRMYCFCSLLVLKTDNTLNIVSRWMRCDLSSNCLNRIITDYIVTINIVLFPTTGQCQRLLLWRLGWSLRGHQSILWPDWYWMCTQDLLRIWLWWWQLLCERFDSTQMWKLWR